MDPTHTDPADTLTSVGENQRIDSIDVLRGLALLGIFVMNIPTFALSYYAFFSPPAHGGFEGPDYWAWLGSHLFFEMKMMSIFSMLFGAGIVLFSQRIESRRGPGRAAGVHYRRMAWLLAIGMLHAYLIWYGDILVAYALVGMLAYLFRKLPPVILIFIAAMLLPIPPLLGIAVQSSVEDLRTAAESGSEDAVRVWSQVEPMFYPDAAALDAERQAILGSYSDQVRYMAPHTVEMQTQVFLMWSLWRVLSMMLLGMALFKYGVLSAKRSYNFYIAMFVISLLIGLPLILVGVNKMHTDNFDAIAFMGVNSAFNAFGSVAVAFAWIALIMLMCKAGALGWVRKALAAVGRMAFTNYIMQSLFGAVIFYGWGFGYFGQLSRSGLLLVVLMVWMFQIIFSLLWLTRYRMGPLEWLWRSLTYWRIEPIARSRPSEFSPEGGTGR
ncbi:MAG: DUF418 domain-containing protein [Phycisphaerales bacterium JB050]